MQSDLSNLNADPMQQFSNDQQAILLKIREALTRGNPFSDTSADTQATTEDSHSEDDEESEFESDSDWALKCTLN